MAYSIKLKIEFKNGKKKEFEPYWWDKKLLIKNYKFKEIRDGVYLDYLKKVSLNLLSSILESQEQRLYTGLYSHPSWQKTCLKVHKSILRLITAKKQSLKAEILIYEWESGCN